MEVHVAAGYPTLDRTIEELTRRGFTESFRVVDGRLRALGTGETLKTEDLVIADIQTTTVYTRLTQSDLQKVISEFDKNYGDGNRDSHFAPPRHVNSGAKSSTISEWWPQRDPNPCFSRDHVFARLLSWLDSTRPSRARRD